MSSPRLLTLIYDDGSGAQQLADCAQSFINQNAAEMSKFKLILYLYRPDQPAVDLVKGQFHGHTPYLMAGAKPPCFPCILSRHKVRYGLVIPCNFVSTAPIWPYVEEFRETLSNTPSLAFISLVAPSAPANTPIIYHQHTRHVWLTEGMPLPPTVPVLAKGKPPGTTPIVSGALKPLVFRSVTQ